MDRIVGITSVIGHGEEHTTKMSTMEIVMAGSSCLSRQISVESTKNPSEVRSAFEAITRKTHAPPHF